MTRVLAAISAAAVLASTAGWQTRAPLPAPHSELAAAPFRNGVAVVGGFRAFGAVSRRVELYAYDTAGGSWRRLPDLPTPRHGLGVIAVGTRAYAIGGSPVADLGFSSANEALGLRG